MNCLVFNPSVAMRTATRWLVAAALVCAAPHVFAFNVYTVGGDAACGFTSIQPAIDAAKANPGQDYIFIAQNFTYSNQALVVTDDDVIIEGGFPNCGVFDNGTNTTLISGTSNNSIFDIEGNSRVGLWNMELTGASLTLYQSGGAIYFGGAGSLSLTNDWIHDNTAGVGGAFAVNPSGPTNVYMLQNLIIGSNTAWLEGGAIFIAGQTTVTAGWSAGQLPIYIGDNTANLLAETASGGGIEVIGPASFSGSARIHDNYAPYGAGIAAYGSGATVNLYTTDPGIPVLVSSNHATIKGGGIYLKPSSAGTVATLCAHDFVIDANTAPNGAAIYVDTNRAYLNSPSCPPPAGALPCATGPSCNQIADNVATAVDGAAVMIQPNGYLDARHFLARGNEAGRLVELIADAQTSTVALQDCLLVDNSLRSSLLWSTGGAFLTHMNLDSCTIAHNQLGDSDPVIFANGATLDIGDSIIDQPSHQSLMSTTTAYAQFVLTNDASSFVGGTGIEQGTPTFVDVANGDYHLQRTSLGVDFAPPRTGVDLDGHPRTVDLTDVPNQYGPLDLGAYEIQTQKTCSALDTIFCNGFDPPN